MEEQPTHCSKTEGSNLATGNGQEKMLQKLFKIMIYLLIFSNLYYLHLSFK